MTPRIFRAPGRVNLIGEHVDYSEGFVLPAAIDFASTVAITPRLDRRIHVHSRQFGEAVEFPLENPGDFEFGHWSCYVRGVAAKLEEAGCVLMGADLAIDSDVPMGAGLSSSAALEVSVALALATVSGFVLPGLELARICQSAEHEYAKTRCGIMDQFIAVNGVEGHALLLDCRSMEHKSVPIPPAVRMIVCNTMVKHQLAASEYNNRRKDCEEAARIIGVRSLRDAPEIPDNLSGNPRRRAQHVLEEIARTREAAAALISGDLTQFGSLMNASHASLRDLFEVSCVELDTMVEIARRQPGVYGARMTGGGFGGCTVNLVDAGAVLGFRETVEREYFTCMGIKPQIYVSAAAAGARELT
ncbi:MAG: galactokinase [Candidatus Solibacter usitatus]|nr:galactokinase [Candidatus Solibacter usitatus]